jgi:hypothetical protein
VTKIVEADLIGGSGRPLTFLQKRKRIVLEMIETGGAPAERWRYASCSLYGRGRLLTNYLD